MGSSYTWKQKRPSDKRKRAFSLLQELLALRVGLMTFDKLKYVVSSVRSNDSAPASHTYSFGCSCQFLRTSIYQSLSGFAQYVNKYEIFHKNCANDERTDHYINLLRVWVLLWPFAANAYHQTAPQSHRPLYQSRGSSVSALVYTMQNVE